MNASAQEKFIVALDVPDAEAADRLLDQLGDSVRWVKVGLQLFTAEGPSLVQKLKSRGYKVFLDLKFHDIPNTVHGAIRSAVNLGVEMTTMHFSGGARMIAAAHKAAEGSPLLILGITVLTSFDEAELAGIGLHDPVEKQVRRLVDLGVSQGVRGVVCSPLEIAVLRQAHGSALTIVTPGVRPAGGDKGDQSRVMTPSEAIRTGADYLVIGRPITGAPSPKDAARAIAEEITQALG